WPDDARPSLTSIPDRFRGALTVTGPPQRPALREALGRPPAPVVHLVAAVPAQDLADLPLAVPLALGERAEQDVRLAQPPVGLLREVDLGAREALEPVVQPREPAVPLPGRVEVPHPLLADEQVDRLLGDAGLVQRLLGAAGLVH